MRKWDIEYDRSTLVGAERRRHKRKDLETQVGYSSENRAKARNISIGGICIEADQKLSMGTILFLVIPLKDNGMVQVIAEVVWCRKGRESSYDIGLEFFCLNDYSKEKIVQYIYGMKDNEEAGGIFDER